MEDLSGDKIAYSSIKEFIEQNIKDWKSKMIKVYEDQFPYILYVTAGHDFEDLILKIEGDNASVRAYKKSEAFANMEKMSEIDKCAAIEFEEILLKMENKAPTSELKKLLNEKKMECAKVFDLFDQIVAICENYCKLEYLDCMKRISNQEEFQDSIINEVEIFIHEVEDIGNTELNSLRDRISELLYNKGLCMLNNVNVSYDELSKQPSAMKVWFECSDELTSRDVHNAFLADQEETFNLWRKTFDDLLMLSTKLEKYRCNYNLIKFKLEQEIFWMSRDYKENMPKLTKIQRHLNNLIDYKATLKLAMKNSENEVQSEERKLTEIQKKMSKMIMNAKRSNKLAHQSALKNFKNSVQIKKEEMFTILSDIMYGDKYIYESILGINWNPVDISHLKPEDDKDDAYDMENNNSSLIPMLKILNETCEESSSDAFQSCEIFFSLLNSISHELGYMLDFTWVDYIKDTLNLTQEMKWLQLFKVFKINLEDLKDLKEHMVPYCKLDNDKNVIFDVNGAIDGFLNFAKLKRQFPSQNIISHHDYDLEDYKQYLISVQSTMKTSLLWKSVQDLLLQYLKLLEIRAILINKKLELVESNKELENYLHNYHKYDNFCI